MLLDWLKAPGTVSVFVVNSRALVSQQAEYLKTHSLNDLRVGDLGPPHPDVTWQTWHTGWHWLGSWLGELGAAKELRHEEE